MVGRLLDFEQGVSESWVVVDGRLCAVMQELRERADVVQPPWLCRHFEVHPGIALVAHEVLRLEVCSLQLGAAGDVEESWSPPDQSIIGWPWLGKILRLASAN